MQHKNGFFIKNIIAIGGKITGDNCLNGEYTLGRTTSLDKHPIVLNDGVSDSTRVERIVNHIKLLADYAKENHHIERLTRLITNEFSFYTRSTPLSLDEYRSIINKAAEVLINLPPNIVLIISSFPVLWSDGMMRNAVLHIQSPNVNGSFPIIHHFSKESFSRSDIYYSWLSDTTKKAVDEKDCYQFGPDDYFNEHSPDIVLQQTQAICYDSNQYKNIIVVYGLNLPPIIETIEICYDHYLKTAQENLNFFLEHRYKEIPFHISHIVSSNTIRLDEKALNARPIHADHDQILAGDVGKEKMEKCSPHFGEETTLHVYHQMRVEVINNKFEMLAYRLVTNNIPINSLIDPQQNTLLHQMFLFNKNCLTYYYSDRQLNNLDNIIDSLGDLVNQQNIKGETPLHLALKKIKYASKLFVLLMHGARLDIRNKKGQSPIQVAYQHNNAHLIHSLIKRVIDHKNFYLNHRDTILTLLNEIQDNELRIKLATSALCYELLLTPLHKIDEAKVVELLMIIDDSLPKIFLLYNIRACRQLTPHHVVPRLVRGIQLGNDFIV